MKISPVLRLAVWRTRPGLAVVPAMAFLLRYYRIRRCVLASRSNLNGPEWLLPALKTGPYFCGWAVEITPIFKCTEFTFIDCVGSLSITLAVFQLDVV